MIWFACKQCAKVHGRAETAAGAMIFCECGQGMLVPWESTAPEPELPPIQVAATAPPPLKLEPVTFDPVKSSGTPLPSRPPLSDRGRPGPRRRPRLGPRDPRYCFNHEELLKEGACTDCGENFCSNCLVAFQGQTRCGPCKNYRVRGLLWPTPTSKLALASAFLAFVPAFFLIAPAHSSGLWFLGTLAMVPQVIALVLGLLALRASERDPNLSGRALAFTGVIGSAVTSILIVLLTIYAPRVWT
ncbi:MAG: DUF4190 domain-containing protein [Planctomycetes bacterium]|nr:DUF4190 domain-containing protein [Planctomycetota bacterium]